MAKLTEPVKDFIVRELAAYSTPTQVVELVKQNFGVIVTRQKVWEYDATTTRNALGKKRRVLFEKARKAFLENVNDIPIASRAVRLKKLNRLVESAEEKGAVMLTANLLEQAAKEVGDVYTNRTKADVNLNVHENWLSKLPPPATA